MSNSLQFELVAPEKLLVSKAVAMATVPGGEGDYSVLPGHAPLITTVRPGVIYIYEQNDQTITDRIFVAGGFAETTMERCTVLAEVAIPVSELDRIKIEAENRSLNEQASFAKDDIERARIEEQLAILRAKLEAVEA